MDIAEAEDVGWSGVEIEVNIIVTCFLLTPLQGPHLQTNALLNAMNAALFPIVNTVKQ